MVFQEGKIRREVKCLCFRFTCATQRNLLTHSLPREEFERSKAVRTSLTEELDVLKMHFYNRNMLSLEIATATSSRARADLTLFSAQRSV